MSIELFSLDFININSNTSKCLFPVYTRLSMNKSFIFCNSYIQCKSFNQLMWLLILLKYTSDFKLLEVCDVLKQFWKTYGMQGITTV